MFTVFYLPSSKPLTLEVCQCLSTLTQQACDQDVYEGGNKGSMV